jgi:hypothetical protein
MNTAQVHTTLKRKPQSSAYYSVKKKHKIVCGVNSYTIVVKSDIGSVVIG